jgi:hypothetical protein
VIDLTGGRDVASPHALALVRAVARAAESELARRLALDDARIRAAYDRRPRVRGTAALVSPGGRVLHATGDLQITGLSWLEGAGAGCGTLPDGRRLVIEPVGLDGYLVVRFVAAADPAPRRTAVRLSALGRDNAVIEIDGRSVQLSPRHSEIAVILALAGGGLSAGRLAVDLSLDAMSNVTVRADMCRLRTALGESLVGSQPYQFLRPIRSDAHAVRDLLAEGRPGDALDIYPGPLLPSSQAPAIVERREALDQQLRGSVLAGRDSKLIRRWVDAPWGAEDLLAWETLAGLLPGGSPQRAAAALRAQALRG